MTIRNDDKSIEYIKDIFDARPVNDDIKAEILRTHHLHRERLAETLLEAEVDDQKVFIWHSAVYGIGPAEHVAFYNQFIRRCDERPSAIYLGCLQAAVTTEAEPGDLVVATSAYSDDEVFGALARTSKPEHFDKALSSELLRSARARFGKVHTGQVYSTNSGCLPWQDLTKKSEGWDNAWKKFSLSWGPQNGFQFGEYETGDFVAMCSNLSLPSAMIGYVREKYYPDGSYQSAVQGSPSNLVKKLLLVVNDSLRKPPVRF